MIDRLVERSRHPYECLASHIEYSLSDCTCCKRAGHAEDCPGNFDAAHVLLPGWIAYEDEDGFSIEIEVVS